MKLSAYTLPAAIALASLSLDAQAGASFTVGAEYTRGDYGTGVDTSSWYIPFSLDYAGDNYAVGITVPFIAVSGSSEVTGISGSTSHGMGGGTTSTMTTTTVTERTDAGLGDVQASASYLLMPEGKYAPWLAITGKVKFGTASASKNLGTGENDYAVQLEIAKGAFDAVVGYNVLGDTDTVDYDNIYYGSVAWSTKLKEKGWRFRTELYAEQEALPGSDPVQELTLSVSKPLNSSRRVNLYLIKGFTDSSPDWGAGVMVSTDL